MRTEAQKRRYTKNFISSRAKIIADGGKQINILLDPEVAEALEELKDKHPTRTYKGVLSDLVLKAYLKPRRGGARSK